MRAQFISSSPRWFREGNPSRLIYGSPLFFSIFLVQKFESINGLLFPGGGTDLVEGHYFRTASKLWKVRQCLFWIKTRVNIFRKNIFYNVAPSSLISTCDQRLDDGGMRYDLTNIYMCMYVIDSHNFQFHLKHTPKPSYFRHVLFGQSILWPGKKKRGINDTYFVACEK